MYMSSLTLFCILLLTGAGQSQSASGTSTDGERHIRALAQQLPVGSLLRKELLSGARGDGVRHAWMDQMQQLGIRSAVVSVEARFNRRGKPVKMRVARLHYYSGYDNTGDIADQQLLSSIRTSGLEKQLTGLGLQKATHAAWIDVPRPRAPSVHRGHANRVF
jgi:hypothetical protein